MIPKSVTEWSRHSRSRPMQCRHRKKNYWNDWNDWNSWSDTAKVVANEKQLTIVQDTFPGRTESEPKGGCDFAAKL